MSVTAIVLCGGQSTRMGQDKGSLPFGGESMLGRITRILPHCSATSTRIWKRSSVLIRLRNTLTL